MYSLSTQLPPSGSFLMLWTFNGEVWSEKLKYFGETLHRYDDRDNEWCSVQANHLEEMYTAPGVTKVMYVVSGDY